jgi:hypothetical protein
MKVAPNYNENCCYATNNISANCFENIAKINNNYIKINLFLNIKERI